MNLSPQAQTAILASIFAIEENTSPQFLAEAAQLVADLPDPIEREAVRQAIDAEFATT